MTRALIVYRSRTIGFSFISLLLNDKMMEMVPDSIFLGVVLDTKHVWYPCHADS